jgi:poly(A)-specific ribonuclease
LSIAE